MTGTLLITGASGYIGSRLAERYLAETKGQVVLWSHATDGAQSKRAKLQDKFSLYSGRVTFVHGDLAADNPFADVDGSEITEIVHGAALTQFNIEAEAADTINRAGSERVFSFAATCPRLRHIAYLGTIYSTGLTAGSVTETLLAEEPAFANHYEASKHRAERVLATRFDHLPWTILRLATVIANDESGEVSQVNAFHNTLRLLRYGLLPLLPGQPGTPLYFVTGEFTVRTILSILLQEGRHEVWNLCHGREDMPTVRQLLDIAYDTFQENEDFRSRRILRPLFADYETFQSLVAGLDGIGNPVTAQAIRSVTPFARQLYITKDVVNDRLRALDGAQAPDMAALLSSTCRNFLGMRSALNPVSP
jgi:nucleoside-diphosphate-sugar epimerase